MKNLFILSGLLAASTAMASPFHWDIRYTQTGEANSPDSFRELQKRFPNELGGRSADNIHSASVSVTIYELMGPHTCAPHDPRTTHRTAAVSICEVSNGMGMCSATSQTMPPPVDRDPCAE